MPPRWSDLFWWAALSLMLLSALSALSGCFLPPPAATPLPHPCDDAYVDVGLQFGTSRQRGRPEQDSLWITIPISRANLRCLSSGFGARVADEEE